MKCKTTKAAPAPVKPPKPTAEQGGHNWGPGTGMAVCTLGCGAFEEEFSGDEPDKVTHLCPKNSLSPTFDGQKPPVQRKKDRRSS